MREPQNSAPKPHVLLFKSQACPHCPTVLKGFSRLKQQGRLADLQVYDVAQESELAAHYGVRSVPWFRIETLEFQGLHSAAELEYWVSHAATSEGIQKYIIEQLEGGQLQNMAKKFTSEPGWLNIALDIIADLQSPMQARIGIGAILEGLAGTPLLVSLIPALGKLTRHGAHSVRIDACHYLGLSGDPAARPSLEQCLADPDANVREVAQESLALLSG